MEFFAVFQNFNTFTYLFHHFSRIPYVSRIPRLETTVYRTGFQGNACSHICTLRIYHKKYIIISALTYTTYCYVFYMRPGNQPRITPVTICHKKVGHPRPGQGLANKRHSFEGMVSIIQFSKHTIIHYILITNLMH